MMRAYSADRGAKTDTVTLDQKLGPGPAWCTSLCDMLGEWKQPLPGEACSQVARCGGVEAEGGASGVKVFRQDLSEKGRSQPHKGECAEVCMTV